MTIVGEWTPSNTDCSQKMDWVTYREKDTYQQIGWGSRYDGTLPGSTVVGSCKGKSGNAEGFSDEHKRSLRKFAEVQMDQFERGSGWYMWAWVSGVLLVAWSGGRRADGCVSMRWCRKWRTLMTGATRQGWRAGGHRGTLRSACMGTSVREAGGAELREPPTQPACSHVCLS